MSDSSLSQQAGLIALAAGAALALVDLGRWALARPADLVGMMADPLFQVVNSVYFVTFFGLAVALVALYGWLGPRAGRFGLIAFLIALAGTLTQGGNMWFEGFAVPWLARVAPSVFTAEKTITLQVGALAAYLLFALGWTLFGIAVLRTRTVPAVLPVAVIVGGVLGYNSGLPPYGVPLGLALAALGAGLIREGRPAALSGPAGARGPR